VPSIIGLRQHETAVVYVVSPDREEQVLRSLSSLLTLGSRFDTVRICCVGPRPRHWCFADPRISVEAVEPMFGDYFFGNKWYLCDVIHPQDALSFWIQIRWFSGPSILCDGTRQSMFWDARHGNVLA
jgi:hypothetical protein